MVQTGQYLHGSPSSYTAFSTAIWTDFDGSSGFTVAEVRSYDKTAQPQDGSPTGKR